ncbi:hypothetical protein MTR67_044626 [Solanum verrucosum]|uniref:Retrotransposon protein n=1 Tax=Solanum verrucosum TaxID=315347 RepID=A0AAF0ZTT0_SOLVR|nr:hypothetical protein MTR67_044626 [Solanum verrucosum]
MKRDITDFVAKCPNCQQVKVEHQKPGGMTQEIDIPTWKWEVINMDFITGLPRTRRQHESIWVIVDRVTKSVHFLAVKTTYLAEDYTKLYINEIVRFHEVPLSIISDRGSGPQQSDHDPQFSNISGKVNVVADALSRLLMGSVAHVDYELSLISDVKAKQDLDKVMVDLKK